MDKQSYFRALYRTEKMHELLYAKLASHEKNHKLKVLLRQLSDVDRSHAGLWHSITDKPQAYYGILDNLYINFILMLRALLGLAITVKIVERGETNLSERLAKASQSYTLTSGERSVLHKINVDGKKKETALHERIAANSGVLNNIKDVTLGINDGLVEVLAAVVGLAVVISTPVLVFLGGLIVAIAGTLSMSGGAYVSTEYEQSISKSIGGTSPAMSAAYMGIAYILGTIFPLLPFLIGLSGARGIVVSIVITTIVLALVSILISIASDSKITGRLAKTLAISLGAAGATIAIGAFARIVLHIMI